METKLEIDIARLDPEGEDYEGELDSAVLEMEGEKYIHPIGALRYRLNVRQVDSELLVMGKIEQDFNAICSRCGCDFDFTATVPDLIASFEITENNLIIDLTDELRQSIILALPTYPLCREDCLGICPSCGKNLNDGPCDCGEKSRETGWSALDSLNLG